MLGNQSEGTPNSLYNAAITLLKNGPPNHSNLNLYRLGMDTAEYQILKAAWDYFGLNESISKENLERCKFALGFKNALAFKKLLERNGFLPADKFNLIYQ